VSADRVLVVIPVFGEPDITHALLDDLALERDLLDVVVVDNKGDYEPVGWEDVLRPEGNLGWAGGTNHGTRERLGPEHVGVLWLNNDTRLSLRFVAQLREAARDTGAAVVGPVYNCHWHHQHLPIWSDPREYEPERLHLRAPFIDGTAMYVPRWALDRLGLLDDETFVPLGWGAEVDYCLRARAAGLRVAITRGAFLAHERAVTAQAVFGDYDAYLEKAWPGMVAGMEARWGPDWKARAQLDPESLQVGLIDSLPRLRRRLVRRRRRS
jgi:GT2 family glycosyltransferase